MELSERRRKILQAIIDEYIMTAEPVGSSYLLNSHDLGISSATIRNEMALLEELGYLDKPHTSAGRIPSNMGYRVYVDELMNEYRMTLSEINQIKAALHEQYLEINKMVGKISDMMSVLTRYTSVITTPTDTVNQIKDIKLISIDDFSFVMIVVTGAGMVKSRTIKTQKTIESDVLERLSNYLNSKFSDTDLKTITEEVLQTERNMVPVESGLLNPVFDFIADIIDGLSDVDLVLKGTTNIFNYPEFNNIERTKGFLDFLTTENKQFIKELLKGASEDNIKIIIGSENPILKQHDLSMVVSSYALGGQKGKLAIIGPTRMDYSKVVSMLEYLSKYLGDI